MLNQLSPAGDTYIMYVPQSILILMAILVVAMAITIFAIIMASRNDRQAAEDALAFLRKAEAKDEYFEKEINKYQRSCDRYHKSVEKALEQVERLK